MQLGFEQRPINVGDVIFAPDASGSPSRYSNDGFLQGLISDRVSVDIYKKTGAVFPHPGADLTDTWVKFTRRRGVFQWAPSVGPDPVDHSTARSEGACSRQDRTHPELCPWSREVELFWNFIVRTQSLDEVRADHRQEVDLTVFVGTKSGLTVTPGFGYRDGLCGVIGNMHWDGETVRFGRTKQFFTSELTLNFYQNSYSLDCLPTSDEVRGAWDDWTELDRARCEAWGSDTEDSEDESEEELEAEADAEDNSDLLNASIGQLIQENNLLKTDTVALREEIEAKNILIQQLTEDSSSDQDDYDAYAEEIYQGVRIDPFDNEMYTHEEFLDYYGHGGLGQTMWEMNAPEKISKILMYEWILSRNAEVLTTRCKNHIMDKMIEVLL